MSLEKGQRSSSMTRTTSSKGFNLDGCAVKNPEDNKTEPKAEVSLTTGRTEVQYQRKQRQVQEQSVWDGDGDMDMGFLKSVVSSSPRRQRRSSCDFAHTLRTCGLCNRRIGSKKDIYMYRGEVAFCSFECREVQMGIDERAEKTLVASMRNDHDDSKQKIAAGPDGSGGSGAVVSA